MTDYEEYCEAKRDIDEEPLPFSDWLYLEEEAHAEWERTK